MSTSLLDVLGIDLPIVQAPMAGAQGPALAIAVASAGGLGSLPRNALARPHPCRRRRVPFAHLGPVEPQLLLPPNRRPRSCRGGRPFVAFPTHDVRAEELGLDPSLDGPSADRRPFDDPTCALVEELRPEIVSFHFGLPSPDLMARVRATGAIVLSSATTVDEARWLAAHGCDVVIAQGVEAGGHRGMFLQDDFTDMTTQLGTFSLVPQVVAAIDVPVIAAGGIVSAAGTAAARSLGASAVQIGTAFLLAPEATISTLHRDALRSAEAEHTAVTNVFTGRPARGIVNRLVREVGPLTDDAPPFPIAAGAVSQLRAAAEARGSTDFTALWSGQSARLAVELPAAELTRRLAGIE